jgi:hypothetical protein
MGWGMPEVNVGRSYNATGKSSRQEAAEREAARQTAAAAQQQAAYQAQVQQQAAAQQAAYDAQVAEYNRLLAEQAAKIREIQESAERTQVMAPPEAQDFSKGAEQDDKRVRRSSSRGSLLAGNTGGYNPATGGGRLGGRSLLG